MPSLTTLVLFLPAAAAIAASPGANNLLALRNGMRQGARDAIVALSGRALAFIVMVGLVAVGLASLLARSQTAFATLKWIGVAYLTVLGLRLVVSGAGGREEPEPQAPRRSAAALARQEFLVAGSNPKALLLFTAFVPQFVDRHHAAAPQLLVLGPLYILIELAAASVWASAGARVGATALSRRARVWLDRATGGVFLGLAAVLVGVDRR